MIQNITQRCATTCQANREIQRRADFSQCGQCVINMAGGGVTLLGSDRNSMLFQLQEWPSLLAPCRLEGFVIRQQSTHFVSGNESLVRELDVDSPASQRVVYVIDFWLSMPESRTKFGEDTNKLVIRNDSWIVIKRADG